MIRHGRTRLVAVLMSAALAAASCAGSDDADTVDDPPASAAESDDGAADADDPADDTATNDEPDSEPADDQPVPLEDENQTTSAGEGDADTATLEPVAGGEITWGLTNDGTGFNTTGAIAPGSIRVINSMTEPLVALTVDADWAPGLAESITPNDDFTSWTITMRPDLLFHDGEPVDGESVRANLQAFKDSPTVGFALGPVESITTVDELSVEVAMSSPWASFPFQLNGQAGWMVSPSTIGTNETFVSTGPFMLEDWTPGDGARVVRNPNYFRADEGLPYLDAINFKFLVEQTVRRQAFDAGDVDGYQSPGDADIIDFLDDDGAGRRGAIEGSP